MGGPLDLLSAFKWYIRRSTGAPYDASEKEYLTLDFLKKQNRFDEKSWAMLKSAEKSNLLEQELWTEAGQRKFKVMVVKETAIGRRDFNKWLKKKKTAGEEVSEDGSAEVDEYL